MPRHGDAEHVEAALARLSAEYDPEIVFRAMRRLLGKKRWKPGCGKERTYTYEHIVPVDDCPLEEGAEAQLENDAQELAEKKVKAFCERNDGGCTDVEIVDSAPTGGGCTCARVMGVKRCVYVCRWTFTYKCKAAAQ